jgi:polyphosphate kinase 2 (PPK2 family)
MGRLDALDLSLRLSRDEEARRLLAAQTRMLELRLHLGGLSGDGRLGPPVCVLFEGWDASGKGGAIRRLAGPLDPRHVRVASFAAPTFERSLVLEGMILVKFWLHISNDEQLRRFRRREHDPLKAWKLTKEDWRNRERRAAYEEAVEEMLERTDHPLARWQLVEAESKRYARVKVVETAVAEIERGMEARGFPPAARRPARR